MKSGAVVPLLWEGHVRINSNSGDLVGVVEDLAEDGALLLKTENGCQRVLAGDCIHLRALEAS